MAKFKIGDRVRIKKHPHGSCGQVGCIYFGTSMATRIGKTATIEKVMSGSCYRLKGSTWNWSDCMLEKAGQGKATKPKPVKTKFKVDDRVKFKSYEKYFDHKEHRGETGKVTRVDKSFIAIKWSNGSTSNAFLSEETKPYKVGKAVNLGRATYPDMPTLIQDRKEFKGNSVTARYDNGSYKVFSYGTLILELDRNGGIASFNNKAHSPTTSKIQNITIILFGLIELFGLPGFKRDGKIHPLFHQEYEKKAKPSGPVLKTP